MTVLVAIPGKRETWVASDSQVSYETGRKAHPAQSKWAVSGQWAIGICGRYRAIRVALDARADLFDGSDRDDPDESAMNIAANLRRHFEEAGWNTSKVAGPKEWGEFQALIACPGRVWELDADMALMPLDRPWAIGSGGDYALGYVHGRLFAKPKTPDLRALAVAGCELACQLDMSCGGRIYTHHLAAP